MPTRPVFKSECSGIASRAFAGLALPEMLLPMGPSFGLTSGFNAAGWNIFRPTRRALRPARNPVKDEVALDPQEEKHDLDKGTYVHRTRGLTCVLLHDL